MTVISFTNLKGGVGKSSLALHFIYWLAAIKKRSVAAVDADAQASTSTWLETLEMDIKCHRIVDPDQLAEEIPELENQTEYLVVDCPGSLGEATRCVLLSARIAIIPITPSGLDLMSAAAAVRIVKQTQTARGGLPIAGVVINKAVKNTRLLKEAQQVITQLDPAIPFKQIIYQRQAIADAFLQGTTVWGTKGAEEAASDYQKLFAEILRLAK